MLKALVFALWKKVKNLICDVDELNNEVNELNDDVEEIKSKYIKKGEVNEANDITTLKRESTGSLIHTITEVGNQIITSTILQANIKSTTSDYQDCRFKIYFPAYRGYGIDTNTFMGYVRLYKEIGELKTKFDYFVKNELGGTSLPLSIENDGINLHNKVIKDIKNYDDATLSGTPKIIEFNLGGTPYYIKAYPNKS